MLLIAILVTTTCSLAVGQNTDIEKDSLEEYTGDFDINGLSLREDYTEKEIRAALIPPTSIEYIRSEYGEANFKQYPIFLDGEAKDLRLMKFRTAASLVSTCFILPRIASNCLKDELP